MRFEYPKHLDATLKYSFQAILTRRLRTSAVTKLNSYRRIAGKIAESRQFGRRLRTSDFADVRVVRAIWDSLKPNDRAHFRTFVKDLHQDDRSVQAWTVTQAIKSWKAGRGLNSLKVVLSWDPEQGSLSSSEVVVVRRLVSPKKNESLNSHMARIYTWLALVTLRRPSQLIQIGADGLRFHTSNFGRTAEVRIPLVKGQAGRAARWEPIPIDLATDIERFRERLPANSPLLKQVLLPRATRQGALEMPRAAEVKEDMQVWVGRQNARSPRTGKQIHLNFRRLRHTGATHLAMQGNPQELISDVLQQDHVASARPYIDAVGQEFLPVFERADRNLGGRFSMMRRAWFRGNIVEYDDAPVRRIAVFDNDVPAIVGACGNAETCAKNPLIGCYVCEHFLAFRGADHLRVLRYLEGELDRWRSTERSSSRSKVIKDFDRFSAGVREVIELIGECEGNESRT